MPDSGPATSDYSCGQASYWERSCVITSKDQNITKAHARYLEARLIAVAVAGGRVHLDNGTSPPLPALPEADSSDMEFFIEQIRLVLPVLGLDVLREPPASSLTAAASIAAPSARQVSPLFELAPKKLGMLAYAREIEGEFVVLKDAKVAADWKQTWVRLILPA